MIPVFKPAALDWARAEKIATESGDPHQLSNFGPLVTKLESTVAQFLRVDPAQVVIFSNATLALAGAISTHQDSNEVEIPGFSFVATLRAAQHALDKSLSFRDVDLHDWTMSQSPRQTNSRICSPVSPFGADPVEVLSKFSGMAAVIDAAASLGVRPDLSKLEKNHAVCFSLHATKVLGAGEGGIAVFADLEWAGRARSWSVFGRTNEAFEGSGSNAKMSEVQAAFCLSRFEEWPEEEGEWKLAQKLAASISSNLGLSLAPSAFETVNPYWVIRLPSVDHRVAVERHLRALQIGSRRWWPEPLHKVAGQSDGLPHSMLLAETTLGLPMFRGITESQFAAIERGLLNAKLHMGSLSLGNGI